MSQWYFLRVLWEQDGLTQAETAKRAGMKPSNTATALNTLEHRGLVVRKSHPIDKRKATVYLTVKGRKLEKQLIPMAKEVTAMTTEGLSPSELLEIKRGLLRIRANMLK